MAKNQLGPRTRSACLGLGPRMKNIIFQQGLRPKTANFLVGPRMKGPEISKNHQKWSKNAWKCLEIIGNGLEQLPTLEKHVSCQQGPRTKLGNLGVSPRTKIAILGLGPRMNTATSGLGPRMNIATFRVGLM